MVAVNQNITKIYGPSGSGGTTITMTAPLIGGALTPGTFEIKSEATGWQQSSLAAGSRYGGRLTFTSSQDFTQQKYLNFIGYRETSFFFPRIETLANGGLSVFLVDSLGNWAEFNYMGSDTDNAVAEDGGWLQFRGFNEFATCEFVCDLTNFIPDNESGTPADLTDITAVELHLRVGGIAASSLDPHIARIFLSSNDIITGTGGTFSGVETILDGVADGYNQRDLWVNVSKQYISAPGDLFAPRKSFDIGDGSTLTTFTDENVQIALYPTRGTALGALPHLLVPSVNRGVTVNQSASDTVTLTNVSWSGVDVGTGDGFWSCEGNASGTCDLINNQFFNLIYATIGHSDHSGSIFDNCEKVEIDANSIMTGCVIRGTSATSQGLYTAAAAGDFSALDVEFKASNTGYDLTIDPSAGGTWDFSGLSVESGHTLVVRNESATQAITVTIAAGITTSTSTAGGAITIINPDVINTAKTSGLFANSRLQVYNVTTATEIVNAVQAVDWTLNYSEGTSFTDGDTVRVRATYQSGTDYKEPFETTVIAGQGFTVLIEQQDWTDVESFAIDGSTVAEFAPDFPNVEVDITDPDGQTQYARFIAWYGAQLYSSAQAIDEFFGAVDVEDEANFKIVTAIANVKLDNKNAAPVIFTDTDRRLFTDDGSTIIAATSNSIQVQSGKVFIDELTVNNLLQELHTRGDLDATKPNTYRDDNTQITNDDFTLNSTDNGDGTFTVTRS